MIISEDLTVTEMKNSDISTVFLSLLSIYNYLYLDYKLNLRATYHKIHSDYNNLILFLFITI